ncbi:MAG: radical SAM protein [Candidatus Omnitrophica bacterium]|nr:radical SAM protein [Candidatus Omnitrophota bacterium]
MILDKEKKINSVMHVYLPIGEKIKIFPIGIVYLANYIHNKIPRVKQLILDLSVIDKRNRWEHYKKTLNQNKPDIVAFSWRHLRYFGDALYDDELRKLMYDRSYSISKTLRFFYHALKRWRNYVLGILENINYIKWAKRNLKSASIIIGGSGFSIFYRDLLRKLPEGIIGIVGEGEKTLEYLVQGLNYENKRVVRRQGKKIGRGHKNDRIDGDFDVAKSFPAVDYTYIKEIFPNYRAYMREIISVQTNRGCRQRCIYCPDVARDRNIVSCRNPSEVIKEIVSITGTLNTKEIWFPDRLTLCADSLENFSEILIELVDQSIGIRWSGYMRPDIFTRELAQLLVESGLDHFIVPVTSGSQRVVDQLKLGMDVIEVLEGCRLLSKAGYRGSVEVELTFGIIREFPEDIEDTVNAYRQIKHIFNAKNVKPILNFCSVLPESELEDLLIEEGYFRPSYNPISLNPWKIRKFAYMHSSFYKIMKQAYANSYMRSQEVSGSTSREELVLDYLFDHRDLLKDLQ